MTGSRFELVRVYATRSPNVLLALVFLVIPVRCDAASPAHSIFLTPAESGVVVEGSHQHGGEPATHQPASHAKAVPSKDRSMPHGGDPDQEPFCGAEPVTDETPDPSDLTPPGQTDTKSQSPVGATRYLPIPTTIEPFQLTAAFESERVFLRSSADPADLAHDLRALVNE